jgi:protein-disulfide isomerase
MRFPLKSAAASLALVLAFATPLAAQPSPDQRQEVESIVRDYLVAHPEVVEEALRALQTKRAAEAKAKQTETIAKLTDKLEKSAHQAIVGNPDGKITLVEFFDYNCGYCKRALPDMTALISANPDLRIVLKELPILSPGSVEAARVSVAVKDLSPESYLHFHQELLGRPGAADGKKALDVAGELGLDVEKLTAAGNEKMVTDNFIEVQELAEALGINGTPSYVIGGEVVPGAAGFDALQEKVAAVRKCGSATC